MIIKKRKQNIIAFSSLFMIVIIVTSLIYLNYNYQFWTYLDTKNMVVLTEYKGQNIKGYRGRQIIVNKEFLPHITSLDKYAKEVELTIIITNSYRPASQYLTNTVVEPVSTSNHHVGCAIDFNIKYKRKTYTSDEFHRDSLYKVPSNIKSFISKIRNNRVLRWGGDFNTSDPVHIDYPMNINNYKYYIKSKKLCTIDYNQASLRWQFW